mmetsp:Transcript_19672/g.54892  ORF Transcript_19672/g.54892 Transcript_19672/m.54892 type:complete len:1497 (+) Transcript_19672:183-4673(+)
MPSALVDNDGGITEEVMAKHGHSNQPESQQLVAVLAALTEVIHAQSLPLTPTSFFAATMSALEKPDTRSSSLVVQAMCHLLSMVLPRVQQGVLRSKFVGATSLLASLLEEHRQQAGAAKVAMQCVTHMLGCMHHDSWLAAAPAFGLLVSFLTDARPKVRKRAQACVVEVLAGLQASPALVPASEAIARVSQALLKGPENAARAAAAASNKQRSAAEERIAAAVSDALHLIGGLKMAAPLLAAPSVSVIVDLLFQLYPLKQPLLSRHATEALAALCESQTSHVSPTTLAQILMVVIDAGDALWVRKDPDGILALMRLLEAGFLRLAEADPGLCAARLPRAFHALTPQLAAEQDGVRFGTAQALRNLIRGCISADMVAAAASGAAKAGAQGKPSPLLSCMVAVAGALGAQYQESWASAMPVVSEMLEVLGEHSRSSSGSGNAGAAGAGTLALPLLQALGSIISGAEEAAEASGVPEGVSTAAAGSYVAAAHAAIGTALRSLGPHIVLTALPLNLLEGMAGAKGPDGRPLEPRTWLLPLMRKHVTRAPLEFWGTQLMPLAKQLATRASAAAAANQAGVAQACHVLELQIWATLPAFVSWAPDLPTAYPAHAKEMAAAFSSRDDLRGSVCAALERMCLQARRVLRAANTAGQYNHLIGFADPLGDVRLEGDEDEDDVYGARSVRSHASTRGGGHGGGGGQDGGEHHLIAPPEYGPEVAEKAVQALRGLSKNWLSLMCKTFLQSPPEARGPIARSLSAYSAISTQEASGAVFRTAITRLLKVMQDAKQEVPPPDMIVDGGDSPVSRATAFCELALVLSSGLDDQNGMVTLFKASAPGVMDKAPPMQKKSYKVLAYLCEHRPGFLRAHVKEVLNLVVGPNAATASSASKRYRMRCLKPLILILSGKESIPDSALPNLDGDSSGSDDEEEGGGMKASSSGRKEAGAGEEGISRRDSIMATLVSELMLCCKESNMRARSSAYELLVQVAHALDDQDPPAGGAGSDSEEEGMDTGGDDQGGESTRRAIGGGLHTFFSMVMAGLAGQTPHMISASVMALSRLLHEFAPRLRLLMPALLPSVLMLLRSKSREIIKSVLGFVKVCAMRMPSSMLEQQLGPILEGILLWAEDSKNKFKLKVRVIIERLARRCGFEAVAKHIPPSDARLLTHIRKAVNRKARQRAGEGDSEDMDEDSEGQDGRSQRSRGGADAKSLAARTARASDWGKTAIFSDEDEGEGDAKSLRSTKAGGKGAKAGSEAGSRGKGKQRASGGARLVEGGDDPMDLMDAAASRQLTKSAAGVRVASHTKETDDFQRAGDGRMVIDDLDAEDRAKRDRKRRRGGDDYDSDDSDMEDLKGYAGLDAAVRTANKSASVQKAAAAASVKSLGGKSLGAKSVGGKSVGGKSMGGKSVGGRTVASSKKGPSVHSGERYKSKAGAGDAKKSGTKKEPYAYWQFDRKMLNRRGGKAKEASKGFTNMLSAAQSGAAKGAKAKARSAAGKGGKRQRTSQ